MRSFRAKNRGEPSGPPLQINSKLRTSIQHKKVSPLHHRTPLHPNRIKVARIHAIQRTHSGTLHSLFMLQGKTPGQQRPQLKSIKLRRSSSVGAKQQHPQQPRGRDSKHERTNALTALSAFNHTQAKRTKRTTAHRLHAYSNVVKERRARWRANAEECQTTRK